MSSVVAELARDGKRVSGDLLAHQREVEAVHAGGGTGDAERPEGVAGVAEDRRGDADDALVVFLAIERVAAAANPLELFAHPLRAGDRARRELLIWRLRVELLVERLGREGQHRLAGAGGVRGDVAADAGEHAHGAGAP